ALSLWGMILLWKTEYGRVFQGLIATSIFAIGATWSVEGRFLVPLLFLIHVLAAIGCWAILKQGITWVTILFSSGE
ncbi:hypothetical protein MNBD_PLANCTO02-3047, partial [hydrothermal vent metagenome]